MSTPDPLPELLRARRLDEAEALCRARLQADPADLGAAHFLLPHLARKGDAEQAPDRLSPQRKAELQQLANDARAWHARTGKNDILVTDKRVPAARRANDSGDAGNCDSDCPVYTLEGDTICFLEKSECSSNPEDYGTICVYSCISMANQIAPERSQAE